MRVIEQYNNENQSYETGRFMVIQNYKVSVIVKEKLTRSKLLTKGRDGFENNVLHLFRFFISPNIKSYYVNIKNCLLLL